MGIEPRIRPLVDALNATGLVETFTSCEGHYDGAGGCREQAHVGFVLREGVAEEDLVRFLESIVPDPRLCGAAEAELTIAKHHVPPIEGARPEVFFEVVVRPLDARAPSASKRSETDRMLALVTRVIWARAPRAGRTGRLPLAAGHLPRHG